MVWTGEGAIPPSEMLNAVELRLMVDEFEELWGAYSFFPQFPEGLPHKHCYELMREYLEESCQHRPGGWKTNFIYFDYEPENCPFGIAVCQYKDFPKDDYVEDCWIFSRSFIIALIDRPVCWALKANWLCTSEGIRIFSEPL